MATTNRVFERDPLAEARQDDYEQLPEPIKSTYSREEFMWMSDQQKNDLIQQECEPEW